MTSSGWLARLLDLGNHNKVIAVATLLTIVTAVPYVVSKAVGAFAEQEDPDAKMARLLAEAMADAQRQVAVDAESHAMEARLASLEQIVEGQQKALADYGSTALQPGATAEEQRRVLHALQQHTLGKPQEAYADLGRIAEAQAARGATEDAAATYRSRAVLRLLDDPPASLEDYRRAEALAPGDPDSYAAMGGLYFDFGDFLEAGETFARGVERARELGDDAARAELLWLLFAAYPEPMDWEEEILERRRWAMHEATELYVRLVEESSADLRVVRSFGQVAGYAGCARVAEGGDAAGLLEQLASCTGRVEAREPADQAEAVQRWRALAQLAVAQGRIREARGEMDAAKAAFDRAVVVTRAALDSPAADRHLRMDAWAVLMFAGLFHRNAGYYAEAESIYRTGVEVGEVLMLDHQDNPMGWRTLAFLRLLLASPLYRQQRYEEADAVYSAALEDALHAMSLFGDDEVMGSETVYEALIGIATVRIEYAPATVGEFLDRADALYAERIAGTVMEPVAAWGLQKTAELRARLAEMETGDGE